MHILIAKPITVVFGLVLLLDILAGIKKVFTEFDYRLGLKIKIPNMSNNSEQYW